MGFPPLLNSLLSFFHGCKALALPQGRFTAFAPARSARKVGRAFHLPPICYITVSTTASTPGGRMAAAFPLPRALLRAHRPFRTGGIRFPAVPF